MNQDDVLLDVVPSLRQQPANPICQCIASIEQPRDHELDAGRQVIENALQALTVSIRHDWRRVGYHREVRVETASSAWVPLVQHE